MARNVELKARIEDLEGLHRQARKIATSGPTLIPQDDTFFECSTGRLKLREFEDGRGELIFYQREDSLGPKESFYVRTPVLDPASMRHALSLACGQIGRLKKRRMLYLFERTRIHVDSVEGLGDYVELEVVLSEGEPIEAGQREAKHVLNALGIAGSSLVQGAYLDLLASKRADATPQ
ncbi:MAG: class IV adenylate cyclase [Solimonas sp.]